MDTRLDVETLRYIREGLLTRASEALEQADRDGASGAMLQYYFGKTLAAVYEDEAKKIKWLIDQNTPKPKNDKTEAIIPSLEDAEFCDHERAKRGDIECPTCGADLTLLSDCSHYGVECERTSDNRCTENCTCSGCSATNFELDEVEVQDTADENEDVEGFSYVLGGSYGEDPR